MNETTIRAKAQTYTALFAKAGVEPKAFDFNKKLPNEREIAAHAIWMCSRVPVLLVEGKKETAAEWIRFVEGILWSCGVSSFRELTSDVLILG